MGCCTECKAFHYDKKTKEDINVIQKGLTNFPDPLVNISYCGHFEINFLGKLK